MKGPARSTARARNFIPRCAARRRPAASAATSAPTTCWCISARTSRCATSRCSIAPITAFASSRASASLLDSIYIHNRVNGNNDGFHFISAEQVRLSNCTVKCGDDACAMFGSCKLHHHHQLLLQHALVGLSLWRRPRRRHRHLQLRAQRGLRLPHEVSGRPRLAFENISFSDLVLDDVTGPISISVGKGRRRASDAPSPDVLPPVVVRNISFSNIHGNVTAACARAALRRHAGRGRRGPAKSTPPSFSTPSTMRCSKISPSTTSISPSAAAALRKKLRGAMCPRSSASTLSWDRIPAYGLYARNARGLTLQNVRFEVSDARSAPRRHLRSRGRRGVQRLQRAGQPTGGIRAALHRFEADTAHGVRAFSRPPRRSCNSKAKATKESSSKAEICRKPHPRSPSRTAHRSNPSSCATSRRAAEMN